MPAKKRPPEVPLHSPKVPVTKRRSSTVSIQKQPAVNDYVLRMAPQTPERPILQHLDRRMVYLRKPTVEEQFWQQNALEFIVASNFNTTPKKLSTCAGC